VFNRVYMGSYGGDTEKALKIFTTAEYFRDLETSRPEGCTRSLVRREKTPAGKVKVWGNDDGSLQDPTRFTYASRDITANVPFVF
jgi:hypothetical protein